MSEPMIGHLRATNQCLVFLRFWLVRVPDRRRHGRTGTGSFCKDGSAPPPHLRCLSCHLPVTRFFVLGRSASVRRLDLGVIKRVLRW